MKVKAYRFDKEDEMSGPETVEIRYCSGEEPPELEIHLDNKADGTYVTIEIPVPALLKFIEKEVKKNES